MSSIRVAPSPFNTGRALKLLSKWAVHYSKENALHPDEGSTPDELIEMVLSRRLAVRERIFQQHLPFSWLRFLIGLMSLVLVFSDIFRSGLSVSNLRSLYPVLQPDEVVYFGAAWNHSVFKSTKTEATNCSTTARVWSYKFDTTSISWRAFASYLRTSDVPACFFYREPCPSKVVCGNVAFKMIDSLVNSVAKLNTRAKLKSDRAGPVSLMLRTENEFLDRFHQFLLLPWLPNSNWRTNQALYYSPELLSKLDARTICFPDIGGRTKSPRFCQQLWINFNRSCASTNYEGRAVGLLHVHALDRVRNIQTRFPNLTVDLTLLESADDLQLCRGGLASLGFRWSDVSTVIRARSCTDDGNFCETLFVDDYRYETGLMITDIVQWYNVIAALRIIGQSYFFLRGISLMLSCYFVHNTPKTRKKLPIMAQLQKTFHLFMKVPTQCVVYGSPFPIVCYVLAHLLDAPLTYQRLESQFLTADGVLNIKLESFISYAVVQMRNVWVYALVWHCLVSVSTSRFMGQKHQLYNGIIGVPEFLLSAFSSVTLIAQYRSTSFRSTKILSMIELPNNISRAWEIVKYRYSFGYRGNGNTYLGGVFIDLKFLICLVIVVAILRAARMIRLHYLASKHGKDKEQYSQWIFLSPTPVPYSVGVLWPTVSMCVHWTSDFFCIQDFREQRQNRYPAQLTESTIERKWRTKYFQVAPFSYSAQESKLSILNRLNSHVVNRREIAPSVRMSVGTFRYIQHQMKCLHGRSDVVEANVAFMNAVLMSDPLVYLRMMFGRNHTTELAYYQSLLRPRQILLLPVVVVGDHNEYSHDLKLLKRVNASQLAWTELVQCG